MGRVRIERAIMLAVPLCLTATVVTGLRCYNCRDVSLLEDISIVNTVFRNLAGNSPLCKTSVDESTAGVKVDDCPTPAFGKMAKCANTGGEGSLSFLTFDFKATYYGRECVEEDIGSPDSCKRNNDEDKSLFANFLRTIGFNVLSYDGTRCTCSTDLCNGQSRLTCGSLLWLAGLALAVLAGCRLW